MTMLHTVKQQVKHYDNSNQRNVFDTKDVLTKIEEYNNYLDALQKIQKYINKGTYVPEKLLLKKSEPFYIIVDSVALSVSRFKKDKIENKSIGSFTTAMTDQILSNLDRYEKYFNDMNEDLYSLKNEYKEILWQTILKLIIDMEDIKSDNLKLKTDSYLKKSLELTDFRIKTKECISNFFGKESKYLVIEKIQNDKRAMLSLIKKNIPFDAPEIAHFIENIEYIKNIIEQEKIKSETEKTKLNSEKKLNAISAKNDELLEVNKLQKNTISALEQEKYDLQKQVEDLQKIINSPHKLAAKDLKDKLANAIKKIKEKPIQKTNVLENSR